LTCWALDAGAEIAPRSRGANDLSPCVAVVGRSPNTAGEIVAAAKGDDNGAEAIGVQKNVADREVLEPLRRAEGGPSLATVLGSEQAKRVAAPSIVVASTDKHSVCRRVCGD